MLRIFLSLFFLCVSDQKDTFTFTSSLTRMWHRSNLSHQVNAMGCYCKWFTTPDITVRQWSVYGNGLKCVFKNTEYRTLSAAKVMIKCSVRCCFVYLCFYQIYTDLTHTVANILVSVIQYHGSIMPSNIHSLTHGWCKGNNVHACGNRT